MPSGKSVAVAPSSPGYIKRRIRLGAHFSEGSRQLWTLVLRTYRGNVPKLAATVKSDASTVTKHLYGDRRVGHDYAVRYTKLGVPFEAWGQRPRRLFLLPALRPRLLEARKILRQSPAGLSEEVLRQRLNLSEKDLRLVLEALLQTRRAQVRAGVWSL